MTKVYVLESWNYDEYELLGVFASFDVEEGIRIRLGHKKCGVREFEVRSEDDSRILVELGIIHTVKLNGAWEEWRAYTDQPSAYHSSDTFNTVRYYGDKIDEKDPRQEYFSESWLVSSTSLADGIKLLQEAMGDKYTQEIDNRLREDML